MAVDYGFDSDSGVALVPVLVTEAVVAVAAAVRLAGAVPLSLAIFLVHRPERYVLHDWQAYGPYWRCCGLGEC